MVERKRRGRRRRLRLRGSEAIAAGAAIALFALLFFSWYDLEYTGGFLILDSGLDTPTAWESFDLIAPLLALASVLTLALLLARLLRPDWKPLLAPGAAITVVGGAATLLVLFRILVPADIGELGGLDLEPTPNLNAYLGLAAALGIAVGGYRSMRAEGSSFGAVADALHPEPRQREDRGREGKDAGSPPKRAH